MATAPNTPTSYYLDTEAVRKACKKDFEKIDKACGPEPDQSNKHKPPPPMLRKMLGEKRLKALTQMQAKVKDKYKIPDTKDNAWHSHCDGLWIKPDGKSFTEEMEEFNKGLKEMSDDLAGAVETQLKPLLEQVGQEIKDKAIAEAKEKALKAGARSGARWAVGLGGAAVGGVGAVATEAVATAWNVCDWVVTGYEAGKMGVAAYNAISEMKTVLRVAQTAQSELADLASNLTKKTATSLMADGMGVLSRFNECTRARRCQLVPYDETNNPAALGGKGCCPGQSGHHVLPDEMTKNGNCPGYTKGGAPTLCVEGANNSNGSHGLVHKALDSRIQDHKSGWFGRDTVTYPEARNMGVKSIQETFPESQCDSDCLKAQLDEYYKNKCTKDMPAVAGVPGGGKPSDGNKI